MVQALATTVERAPENNDTDAEDPELDHTVLTAIATAIRDGEWLRFDYRNTEQPQVVEPYRLIAWQRRWYLVARDPAFFFFFFFRRVGHVPRRLDAPAACPRRRRFSPVPVPGGDFTAYAMRSVAHDRMERARTTADRGERRSRARPHPPGRRRGRVGVGR